MDSTNCPPSLNILDESRTLTILGHARLTISLTHYCRRPELHRRLPSGLDLLPSICILTSGNMCIKVAKWEIMFEQVSRLNWLSCLQNFFKLYLLLLLPAGKKQEISASKPLSRSFVKDHTKPQFLMF